MTMTLKEQLAIIQAAIDGKQLQWKDHQFGGDTAMKTIGILFQADMVRAILAGRKTLTSRLLHPQPEEVGFGRNCCVRPYCTGTDWPLAYYETRGSCWNSSKPLVCPYGGPGDVLLGRETWLRTGGGVLYRADYDPVEAEGLGGMYGGWKPSIHMPFSLSRLRLEITRVWASRLQDMTEEIANQEGCPSHLSVQTLWPARADFAVLWDRINSAKPGRSWSENPWVWRIEFKRIEP